MTEKKSKRFVSSKSTKKSNDLETEDIYEDKQREEMLREDEITAAEDGFMRGREMTTKTAKKLKKTGHKDTVSIELAEEEYEDD